MAPFSRITGQVFKSGILGHCLGGNVTIFTRYQDYFYYHRYQVSFLSVVIPFLIFYVPELFLFLLSFVDNYYVDMVFVYKVDSYS